MAKPSTFIGNGILSGTTDPSPFNNRAPSYSSLQQQAAATGQHWGGNSGQLFSQPGAGGAPVDAAWSSGWASSQPHQAGHLGTAPSLPRLSTPDSHLGRAPTVPPPQEAYANLIGRGDLQRHGSGFSEAMRPGTTGLAPRGGLHHSMLGGVDVAKYGVGGAQQVGQMGQPWGASGNGAQLSYQGQRLPGVSVGPINSPVGPRLYPDADRGLPPAPSLAVRPHQMSAAYNGQVGAGYGGSTTRPGSAGSVHSSSSYSRAGLAANGMPNGLSKGALLNGLAPAGLNGRQQQQHAPGDLEQQVLQQLHSLALTGAGPGSATGHQMLGAQRGQQQAPGYQQATARPQDQLALAMLQGRQGAPAPNAYGLQNGLGVGGNMGMSQAQMLAARGLNGNAAANINNVLRGLNGGGGNVGNNNPPNVNLLQMAAAQAAARTAAVQQQQRPGPAYGNQINNLNFAGAQNDLKQFANQAALLAEASRRQQQAERARATLEAWNTINPAYQAMLGKPKVPPPARPAMPPRPGPPAPRPAPNNYMPAPVENTSLAHDQTARNVLMELGQTLAQLSITVENAVNAGLLGGLSAADVKVLSDAHAHEARRLAIHAHAERLQQQALSTSMGQPPAPPPMTAPMPALQHNLSSQASASLAPPAQALFPQTFQLGSTLTDTPRPMPAMDAARAPTDNYSLSSTQSSSSPFSFFGGLMPADVSEQHHQQLHSGDSGRLPKVLDSGAELFDIHQQGQVNAGDSPQSETASKAASELAGAHFDASAYAFFGSVDASHEDALPLEEGEEGLLGEGSDLARALSSDLCKQVGLEGEQLGMELVQDPSQHTLESAQVEVASA